MNINALQKAIKYVGSQKALAKAIGSKQQTVNWWLHKSRKVPPEYVLSIERVVNGAVTRYDLRPDIYPREK